MDSEVVVNILVDSLEKDDAVGWRRGSLDDGKCLTQAEATTTIRHVFPSFIIERSDYDVV